MLLLAVVVSTVGALVVFALGMIDIGLGLVAVAAFLGWATALALVWRGREGGVQGAPHASRLRHSWEAGRSRAGSSWSGPTRWSRAGC